jgi:hypothetical protein
MMRTFHQPLISVFARLKNYSGEILPTAGLISTLTKLRSGVLNSWFRAYAMTAFPPLIISISPPHMDHVEP